GWTDIEEIRLGLDPKGADSDGDGRPDGNDVCPDYAPRPEDETDEELTILQRAIFATYGLSGSRDVLLVGKGSRRLQVWGYHGPILYNKDPDEWLDSHGSGIRVNWAVSRDGDEATVTISDYEGPEAAGSQSVSLRRIGAEWYVIRREMGVVS